MSTTAIVFLAAIALMAWLALLEAAKEALAIRAKASACPCRDIHSLTLTPGSAFELPAGTDLSAGTHADPRVVSYTQRPIEVADLTTRFRTKGLDEALAAFHAARDASDTLKKGH